MYLISKFQIFTCLRPLLYIIILGQWQLYILSLNASIFVDFGYGWCYMICKLIQISDKIKPYFK